MNVAPLKIVFLLYILGGVVYMLLYSKIQSEGIIKKPRINGVVP